MKKIAQITLLLLLVILLPQEIIAQNSNDPYAATDSTNQLRPTINRADFFREKDFDFGWLLLEPINLSDSLATEPNLTKRFSDGQKALYFWWYLDAQVTNGGFTQFYLNEFDIYVPAILRGLKLIGDKEMYNLLKKAHAVYLKNKTEFEDARKENHLMEELYDKIDDLFVLDVEYYGLNDQTMALIEKYARANTEEFCVDENGKIIDGQYTGECNKLYESGKVSEKFELINGEINGDLVTFYESGKLESKTFYSLGKPTGKYAKWHENGEIARRVGVHPKTGERKKERFHKNGKKAELSFEDAYGEQYGLAQSWYPNGQLKEESTYGDYGTRDGKWLKFWQDGSKKLEAEFRDGIVYFQNYWTEEGEQILTNGTGLYINEYELDFMEEIRTYRVETNYKNYEKHGIYKSFVDGVLLSTVEYKNGLHHGWTRQYNDDGSIESETFYENGIIMKAPKTIKKS